VLRNSQTPGPPEGWCGKGSGRARERDLREGESHTRTVTSTHPTLNRNAERKSRNGIQGERTTAESLQKAYGEKIQKNKSPTCDTGAAIKGRGMYVPALGNGGNGIVSCTEAKNGNKYVQTGRNYFLCHLHGKKERNWSSYLQGGSAQPSWATFNTTGKNGGANSSTWIEGTGWVKRHQKRNCFGYTLKRSHLLHRYRHWGKNFVKEGGVYQSGGDKRRGSQDRIATNQHWGCPTERSSKEFTVTTQKKDQTSILDQSKGKQNEKLTPDRMERKQKQPATLTAKGQIRRNAGVKQKA